MSLPAVGGLIWIKFGHPAVFLFAGGIAVLMLFFSSLVRTHSRLTEGRRRRSANRTFLLRFAKARDAYREWLPVGVIRYKAPEVAYAPEKSPQTGG